MEWFYSLMFSRNENNSLIIGDFRSVSFLKSMHSRPHHLQQIGNLIRDFDLPVKTITQKLEQFLMPRGGSQACQRGFAECSALGITFRKKTSSLSVFGLLVGRERDCCAGVLSGKLG